MDCQTEILIPKTDKDITKDWITKVMRKYHSEPGLTVIEAVVEPFTDYIGYLSKMVTAKVDYTKGGVKCHIDLFIKLVPETTLFEGALDLRADIVEVKFYTQIVPGINKIIENHVLEKEQRDELRLRIPNCLHASYSEESKISVIVLEDMYSQGYVKPINFLDVNSNISKEQFLSMINEIAKLNALGFAVKKYDAENLEMYSPLHKTLFCNTEEITKLLEKMEPMKVPINAIWKSLVEKHCNLPDKEVFLKWVTGLMKEMTDYMMLVKNFKLDDPHFTLNHGDMHCSNFTFKGNDPSIPFVYDWQIVQLGHPSRDLGSLFGTSLSPEDMEEFLPLVRTEWEKRLTHYSTLLGVQEALDVLSREDFNKDWNRFFLQDSGKISGLVFFAPDNEELHLKTLQKMEFLYSKRTEYGA